MLVLSRKLGQQIQIGDNITLTIIRSQGKSVRIGIDAPKDVRVVRAELPPLESPLQGPIEVPQTSRQRSTATQSPSAVNDRRQQAGRQKLAGSGGQARHPDRWSVASMRERTQQQRVAR